MILSVHQVEGRLVFVMAVRIQEILLVVLGAIYIQIHSEPAMKLINLICYSNITFDYDTDTLLFYVDSLKVCARKLRHALTCGYLEDRRT